MPCQRGALQIPSFLLQFKPRPKNFARPLFRREQGAVEESSLSDPRRPRYSSKRRVIFHQFSGKSCRPKFTSAALRQATAHKFWPTIVCASLRNKIFGSRWRDAGPGRETLAPIGGSELNDSTEYVKKISPVRKLFQRSSKVANSNEYSKSRKWSKSYGHSLICAYSRGFFLQN
jgi:hypothetical protein